MTTMTFNSQDPDQQSVDVLNPNSGDAYKLERMLRRPELWDANHPLHYRAKSDVAALSALVYGDGPAQGGGSPTMSFDTTTGEPIVRDAMMATGEGLAEEEHKVD